MRVIGKKIEAVRGLPWVYWDEKDTLYVGKRENHYDLLKRVVPRDLHFSKHLPMGRVWYNNGKPIKVFFYETCEMDSELREKITEGFGIK